jgi:Staphylococcal nuclease homologue
VIKEAFIAGTTIAVGIGGAVGVNIIFGSDGEAAPEPGTAINETMVSVERVIDGDTVVTSAGTVRLLGIDAPDKGQCGYDEAALALSSMLQPGKMIGLVATDKDTDQYNRLLRYIKVDEMDAGYQLIRNDVADARYDSRDGYTSHPLEEEYRGADTVPNSTCVEPPPPSPASPGDPVPPATAAPTPRKFEVVPSPNFFTPAYFPPEYFPPTPQPARTPPGTVVNPNPRPPTSPPPGTPIPSPEPTLIPDPSETITPSPDPTETITPSPDPTETTTPSPDPTETITPSPDPTETTIPDPEPTETFTPPPPPEPTETFFTPPPEPTVTVSVG